MLFYYLYHSKDGYNYVLCEELNPYLMESDYLLFDSLRECVSYWENQGVKVDRYAL